MTKYQKYYRRGKAKATEEAVNFQFRIFDEDAEEDFFALQEEYEKFRKLGRRFGLMQEFRENLIV